MSQAARGPILARPDTGPVSSNLSMELARGQRTRRPLQCLCLGHDARPLYGDGKFCTVQPVRTIKKKSYT